MTAASDQQLAAQERTIAHLKVRIAEQDARIAELKRQLAASSRSSSKPPSADRCLCWARRLGHRPGARPGLQMLGGGKTLAGASAARDEVRSSTQTGGLCPPRRPPGQAMASFKTIYSCHK